MEENNISKMETASERERERERQTDRQTDRDIRAHKCLFLRNYNRSKKGPKHQSSSCLPITSPHTPPSQKQNCKSELAFINF